MIRIPACRAVVALLLAFASIAGARAVTPITAFEATLRDHLAAIEGKDLDRLLATITTGESLTLIFPDGERWDTRRQYVDFHRDWFRDTRWTMKTHVERTIERGDMALAFVRYRFDTTRDDGTASHSDTWLTLVFVKEGGAWRLVFDQNTKITTPPPAAAK